VDYKGLQNQFLNIQLLYRSLSVGLFGVKCTPLDIKHGPDWEYINRQKLNGPPSTTLRKYMPPSEKVVRLNSILGYLFNDDRFPPFAWITDAGIVPDHTREILKEAKLKTLIINAVWPTKKHASHLSMDEAIELGLHTNAEKVYIVHSTNKVFIKDTNNYLQSKLAFEKQLTLFQLYQQYLIDNKLGPELEQFEEARTRVFLEKETVLATFMDDLKLINSDLDAQINLLTIGYNMVTKRNEEAIADFKKTLSPKMSEVFTHISESLNPRVVQLAYDGMEIDLDV
jgi:hypothetical protein